MAPGGDLGVSDNSAIEWTDATWSPVTGCTRVSPGCAHCYIERPPPFRMEGRRFVNGTTGVRLHPERLDQPMRWRKPRRVFVCSLADLFHEEVPDEYIARVFATMALAPQHTFQVLTKRPERMASLLGNARKCEHGWLTHNGDNPTSYGGTGLVLPDHWPLPNVWLGVSIENARHTWRADVLREIPAAVRFISAEPLLGSLYPSPRELPDRPDPDLVSDPRDAEELRRRLDAGRGRNRAPLDLTGIDWLIAGGESGPGARPMHPDWARELRDACLAPCLPCRSGGQTEMHAFAGEVRDIHSPRPAYFFKQWGEHLPRGQTAPGLNTFGGTEYHRVGKKHAGRLLDGRTWDEMPTVRP